jgi:opine dehydrogenase
MTSDGPSFAVLGTGNSGQTFAADITRKGFSVNLAEVPEFASNLRAIEKRGGIEISGEAGNGFAKLNMITTDLSAAVKGVDIIIIGGSAFAHEPLSKAAAPYFEDGQFVLFTSNFGALRFRNWMQELGVKTDVTPVETMSLIYATRAVEPGKVRVIGLKNNLPAAALPASRTKAFLEKMSPVFSQFAAAENVLITSLNNLNPIVHPPMVLFNAGRIESTGGQGWNLYADGATESVAKIMLAMDGERMSLVKRLGLTGVAFKDSFEALYENYSLRKGTLSATLRRSPIHSDPTFPAPASLDTRYLTEDLPFGLAPWSSMGRLWGVATPTIDAVVRIASIMLGVDYFTQGLSVEDLQIQRMSPEELRASVE